MLAKANRITRGADYRTTVRRGARFPGAHTVVSVRPVAGSDVVRFGFVAGRKVGDAVRRNLVRRRLKAIAYEWLAERPGSAGSAGREPGAGLDIVIRALPGSAQAGWASLHEEVFTALTRFTSRRPTSEGIRR